MAKIVKLKLKDIENIVRKTIKESEFDDFDTKIQPEELPGAEDYEDQMSDEPKRKASIMVDADGNHYVVDDETKLIYGIVTKKDGEHHDKM
jgi:hypothetical protein